MASLLDPRNGPAFDSVSPHSTRCWVLASTPRTGSTLLARTLWSTGKVGAPKEYLNPTQVRDWEVRLGAPLSRWMHGRLLGPAVGLAGRARWTDARLSEHLRRVRQRRVSGGWFGLKIHWHHFERFFVDPGRDPEAYLGPIHWVRIRREERLAQAVSWVRAQQTGAWVAQQQVRVLPVYDRRLIDARLADIDAAEAGWDGVFAGRQVLTLTYEEVARDPGAAAQRVLEDLGASAEDIQPADLTKQADPTDLWVERYRSGA